MMMFLFLISLLDAAPDPVGIGIVAAVVMFVVGFVLLLAAALVVFLWYRKRSMRHLEMTPAEQVRRSPESS